MADLTNPRRAKIPTKKPTRAKKIPVVQDLDIHKPAKREKKRVGNYPEAHKKRRRRTV